MNRWHSCFLLLIVITIPVQVSGQNIKFMNQWFANPHKYAAQIENNFIVEKISQFQRKNDSNTVILENGYASAQIKNPTNWKPLTTAFRVDTIQFIYTEYPKEQSFWLTNYHTLLAARIKALFALDTSLNNHDIVFQIILQTQCNSDAEARKMFHGIAVHFFPVAQDSAAINIKNAANILTPATPHTNTKAEENILESRKINSFISNNGGINDSIVFKVFERHPDWKKILVVMDWTGSMYPYGGQAVLWHSLNIKRSGMKYFVFFNDGDNNKKKKVGRTGGVYFEKAENLKKIVNMLSKIKAKGNGGDTEENDLEAVVKGIQKFPDFENLILIADNNSCMRDFCLLNEIKVPVKVILCGTYTGINPEYLNLAYRTKGSIHTIEDDISDFFAHTNSDASFMIDGSEYRFNRKKDLFEYLQKPEKDDPHYCEPFDKRKPCKCESVVR
jgi:hypothetical protein